MTDELYFSERESGPRAPLAEEVDSTIWGGVLVLLDRRIADYSFARAFPWNCDDPGRGTIATDANAFWQSLRANVPSLPGNVRAAELPEATTVMDVLEFAARHIAAASQADFHGYFGHHHLEFDRDEGLAALIADVNTLFRRNGLAFRMSDA
ncbi:MAG: hypothetical protein QFC55_03560 [Chloroflexota bacterium]|nr:hypothetical protein [Chloroflexota bacterium]